MTIRYLFISDWSSGLFFPRIKAVHKKPIVALMNKIILDIMDLNISYSDVCKQTPCLLPKSWLQFTYNTYNRFEKNLSKRRNHHSKNGKYTYKTLKDSFFINSKHEFQMRRIWILSRKANMETWIHFVGFIVIFFKKYFTKKMKAKKNFSQNLEIILQNMWNEVAFV